MEARDLQMFAITLLGVVVGYVVTSLAIALIRYRRDMRAYRKWKRGRKED